MKNKIDKECGMVFRELFFHIRWNLGTDEMLVTQKLSIDKDNVTRDLCFSTLSFKFIDELTRVFIAMLNVGSRQLPTTIRPRARSSPIWEEDQLCRHPGWWGWTRLSQQQQPHAQVWHYRWREEGAGESGWDIKYYTLLWLHSFYIWNLEKCCPHFCLPQYL